MQQLNYYETFILVADDCPAMEGVIPTVKVGKAPPIHARQYEIIAKEPYQYTQEDILFFVYADRNSLARDDAGKRAEFVAKDHACLRASALTKRYGWGVHFDGDGKAALYGRNSNEYRAFEQGRRDGVKLVKAMRSKRA